MEAAGIKLLIKKTIYDGSAYDIIMNSPPRKRPPKERKVNKV
jgi:hypothetical protein